MNRLIDFALLRKARALGAYWDAVVHGSPEAHLPRSAEAAELGTMIRYLHGVADAGQIASERSVADGGDPIPDELFEKHRQMQALHREETTMSSIPLSVPARWTGETERKTRAHQRPRLRFGAALAAAAVVLLALGIALGPLELGRRGNDKPKTIPAAAVQATVTPSVEFLWQSRGNPDDPMDNATNLAIAPDGAIWVPDGRNARFQIFSPEGELLEVWGSEGTGDGQFDFLLGGNSFGGYGRGAIAFAPDGSFYVADTGNFRIQKFGPDRAFITAWGSEGTGDGQFAGASDLAVDGQGRVYVVDAYRGAVSSAAEAIQVFDADGRFLASWGAQGSEPGQLSFAVGITVDREGTILIADYQNNRVQRFTPEGEYLGGWGELGVGEGQISGAFDVAVDSEGHIFEVDYHGSRVQVFDRDGRFLIAWGSLGIEDGEFEGPVAVAVDGEGNAYITDDSGRVQKFRVQM